MDIDKFVKLSIIFGALIVSFSIAYYLVIFLPKKEAVRIELEKQQQSSLKEEQERKEKEVLQKEIFRQQSLAFCLSEADNSYWNYVELNGTGKRDDENGVRALQNVWDTAAKTKQQETDTCFKTYSK